MGTATPGEKRKDVSKFSVLNSSLTQEENRARIRMMPETSKDNLICCEW
jgi:hypothetical protein